MNTPAEMIAVIEAHSVGKTVQYRELLLPEKWFDCHNDTSYFRPAFDRLLYRIKPEPLKPREWWLAVDSDGNVLKVCDRQRDNPGFIPRIHVREVLPDGEWKA